MNSFNRAGVCLDLTAQRDDACNISHGCNSTVDGCLDCMINFSQTCFFCFGKQETRFDVKTLSESTTQRVISVVHVQ